MWEVWNEPDGKWCWRHGPSATEYGNFAIDTAKTDRLLALRRGEESISTTRREADKVHFLSGVVNGVTTGTPICLVIENQNTDSKVYDPEMLRPSHADYCAKIKYNGHQDYRGGGHFSGRITAALTAAGSIPGMLPPLLP